MLNQPKPNLSSVKKLEDLPRLRMANRREKALLLTHSAWGSTIKASRYTASAAPTIRVIE